MKKIILILFVLFAIVLKAQTSEFRRNFSTTSGNPLAGYTGYIYLVPQANTYPTGALSLTEDGTRPGVYYRLNVPDGEYKIYIDVDKGGAGAPSLYVEHYWIGEKRLSTIADHFDATDLYKLKSTGIQDGAITEIKLGNSSVTSYKIAANAVTTDKIASNTIESTNIKDANITFPKLSQAVIDYINASGGGSITNNPDDVTLETKTGSKIGIKQSWADDVWNNSSNLKDSVGNAILDTLNSRPRWLGLVRKYPDGVENRILFQTQKDIVVDSIQTFLMDNLDAEDKIHFNFNYANSPAGSSVDSLFCTEMLSSSELRTYVLYTSKTIPAYSWIRWTTSLKRGLFSYIYVYIYYKELQ